jgi:hypothetical protein
MKLLVLAFVITSLSAFRPQIARTGTIRQKKTYAIKPLRARSVGIKPKCQCNMPHPEYESYCVKCITGIHLTYKGLRLATPDACTRLECVRVGGSDNDCIWKAYHPVCVPIGFRATRQPVQDVEVLLRSTIEAYSM